MPALTAGDGATSLEIADAVDVDALASVLDPGNRLLAEVAHRGLRHLPESFPGRLRGAAEALVRVGLRECAEVMRRLAAVIETERAAGSARDGVAVASWADAQIRLLVASDLR